MNAQNKSIIMNKNGKGCDQEEESKKYVFAHKMCAFNVVTASPYIIKNQYHKIVLRSYSKIVIINKRGSNSQRQVYE